MSFSKLDGGILRSSIWFEPLATRVVWITILAMKDEFGYVAASRVGLFNACNVTQEEFDDAMMCLEGPDGDSRTSEYDGRRVEKVEGGWIVLNHDKYRLHSDIVKEQTRERVRKFREKNRNVTQCNVTNVTGPLPSVSVSVSESVSVSSSLTNKTPINIIPDKKAEYFKTELESYNRLKEDQEWLKEQQKYHPGLNILLSMEKVHTQFWGTEDGWEYSRKKRGKTKNWKLQFSNALSQKINQVWLPREQNSSTADHPYRRL